MAQQEIEVFRITPTIGLHYSYVLATRKEWVSNTSQPHWKYYSRNLPKYLGKFIRSERDGYGDGALYKEIYEIDGKETVVDYDYEGMTCLICHED